MKRVVFAHDHIFRIDKDGVLYTGGSFNHNVWNRYTEVFDEVIVIARLKKLSNYENTDNLNLFCMKNVKFIEIPNISSIKCKIGNTKQAKNIINQVLANDIDVLISRLPSEIGSLSISIAKKNKIPYMVEVVACPWDSLWNYGSIQGKLYAPYKYLETKKKVREAENVIYVTNEFLQKRYPNKNNNVGCSDVELLDIDNEILEKRIKSINERNVDETFNIGLIGGLTTNAKGFDVAINAIKRLVKDNSNIKLNILGPGDPSKWKEIVKSLDLEENVKFCGTLSSGSEVYKWIDTMDLYIQPSYQEGLPRAVIEAMSRACIVIGSTAGGIPELLEDDCLHKRGNDEELSKLILKSIRDKEWRVKNSKQNFNRALAYKKSILDEKRKSFLLDFRDRKSK